MVNRKGCPEAGIFFRTAAPDKAFTSFLCGSHLHVTIPGLKFLYAGSKGISTT